MLSRRRPTSSCPDPSPASMRRRLPAPAWDTLAVAEQDLVEEVASELYGLRPGEFTPARNEEAKRLRSDGEREAAEAVRALRKPTVAAWALNQLARRRGKDLERLLKAADELRAAQQELLAGGDRSALHKAAASERELVAKLSADATTLASEAGERGGGLQEKVAETLHAAALDEATAEELRAGRMVREREAIGGFGAPGGPASTPSPKRRPAKSNSSDSADRESLAAARTDERHALRELEAAERAVEHARERSDAAKAHAEEAAERARTTAERLREAESAATAARKAHKQAKRGL